MARLPFNKAENDQYFGFGYYCNPKLLEKNINILIVKPEESLS